MEDFNGLRSLSNDKAVEVGGYKIFPYKLHLHCVRTDRQIQVCRQKEHLRKCLHELLCP